MEAKLKHLEMIQNIINRMANKSFLLKGWSVILVSGLFALGAKETNQLYISLAYFPIIVFWCLDAYFISQERKFRNLYNYVCSQSENEIDFLMDTEEFSNDYSTWGNSFCSKTLKIFYGGIMVIILFLMYMVL